jgi:hypothetical protein
MMHTTDAMSISPKRVTGNHPFNPYISDISDITGGILDIEAEQILW